MYLTEKQIEIVCKSFNVDKSALKRIIEVDTENSSLEQFLAVNFHDLEETFEEFLKSEDVVNTMKLDIDESFHSSSFSRVKIKRIS